MKSILIVLSSLLCINCNLLLQRTKKENNIIPTEIVNSYLHEYFIDKRIFVSIYSSTTNEEQSYLQEDLITNLLSHTKRSNFSYNNWNSIYQPQRENKKFVQFDIN